MTFHSVGNHNPNWVSLFRGVETTNQFHLNTHLLLCCKTFSCTQPHKLGKMPPPHRMLPKCKIELYLDEAKRFVHCGQTHTGWWFGTFFIFHHIWDNPSHWLIFSRWLKPPTSIKIKCHQVFHQNKEFCRLPTDISHKPTNGPQGVRVFHPSPNSRNFGARGETIDVSNMCGDSWHSWCRSMMASHEVNVNQPSFRKWKSPDAPLTWFHSV